MDGQLPPGPKHSLRLLYRWIEHQDLLLAECAERYGDPFTLHLPRLPPFIVLSDPAAIKDVFTGDPEVLLSGRANRVLAASLGTKSLLLLDGDEHLHERKMMLPPFHGERMRAYGDLIEGVVRRTLATWPVGTPFPIAAHVRAIALE